MASCEGQQYIPSPSDAQDLHSTYICNIVFNSVLSFTAILLNVATIHAIRKTSSLPQPLKTLFLSLAVSDLGVGSLVQPFYVSLLIKWSRSQKNVPDCNVFHVLSIVIGFFSEASFFGVVAISVDRFMAIHLHLRYREFVTHKRTVIVVISIWLLSAFLSSMSLWSPIGINYAFFTTIGVICLLVTAIAYFRIYLALKRHKNQIKDLQVQQVTQNCNSVSFTSLRNSAIGVFYVYLVFLVCCSPSWIVLAARSIIGPSIALKKFAILSWTLFFLNSSLNPVIYCWKMRHVRHAIVNTLRHIVPRRH